MVKSVTERQRFSIRKIVQESHREMTRALQSADGLLQRRVVYRSLSAAKSVNDEGAWRLKCDLQMCHKVTHNQVSVLNDDLLLFTDRTSTRGHCYKLYKGYSQVNMHKRFFTNAICDIWNVLPSSVVKASSLTVFKRLLDHVDLTRYCIGIG